MNEVFEATQKVGRPPVGLRNKIVHQVLDFVYEKLSDWRDDPQRPGVEAEKRLNGQLCTYLRDRAHYEEKLYTFDQEEFQAGECQVDLAAKPLGTLLSASSYNSIYEPITVFEAKRLPLPSAARKKEYLTRDESAGGIQRFKLRRHGANHDIAGIIGYIQKQDSEFHYTQLNEWIDELADKVDSDWTHGEKLQTFSANSICKTSRSFSIHPREDSSDILLHHLWVEMGS